MPAGVVYGCGPAYTNNATGYTSTGCPTSFPHATLLGSTFNRSLWHSISSTISDEGRALHNSNGYALITWAPDINPFRDPRWGRGWWCTWRRDALALVARIANVRYKRDQWMGFVVKSSAPFAPTIQRVPVLSLL